MTPNPRRAIPSVDRVVREIGPCDVPRPLVVEIVRRELRSLRESNSPVPDVTETIRSAVESFGRSRIHSVINGTGIIIHTNLGRSPLAQEARDALTQIASSYNTLELDLESGQRGSRGMYVERALALLCEAEAATVVNNCAAALVLVLRHFTAGERKQVVISRGELVQIGGGFRIPDILETSGAVLREVGTTNKTTAADYTRAVSKQTAMVLKVHRSNFYMRGFVESPEPADLALIARKHRIPFVEDLGSGALIRTETVEGLAHERTPAESIRDGADLVCFSGDKLMGGPQAGIIAGKAKRIAALKRDPFFRALRCDKLVLAALQATAELYLNGNADQIPTIAMMRLPLSDLTARAEQIIASLGDTAARLEVGKSTAQAGGGTLPQAAIPSVSIDIVPSQMPLAELARRVRIGSPPVIAFTSGGKLKIDLRTVFPLQDEQLAAALRCHLGQ